MCHMINAMNEVSEQQNSLEWLSRGSLLFGVSLRVDKMSWKCREVLTESWKSVIVKKHFFVVCVRDVSS